MTVSRVSSISGETNTKELDITEEQMTNYLGGMHIQRAFPHLPAEDREFILTGITAEEWDSVFKEEDD